MRQSGPVPGVKSNQGSFHHVMDSTRPVLGHASRRSLSGNYAEEILAAVLGAQVRKTDTRCHVCPDARAGKVFYEFKANLVGNNDITLYLHRKEKESEFAKDHLLHYGVLEYSGDFSDADMCDKLYREMTLGAKRVLVLTAQELHQMSEGRNVCVTGLQEGIGWQQNGYERGYQRVPLKWVRELCVIREWRTFEVHGMAGMTNVWWSPNAEKETRG